MKVPRPQEYVLAVFFIIAAIGPALVGLACHLVWIGVASVWTAVTCGA